VTRARRHVVRLFLKLKLAGIEPVFTGSTYREIEAGLAQQWAGITPMILSRKVRPSIVHGTGAGGSGAGEVR
jgi:hypothetical protein